MAFNSFVENLLGSDRYLPANACLTDEPIIITTYLVANGLISLSLFIIAGVLLFSTHPPSSVRPIMKGIIGLLFCALGMNYLSSNLVLFISAYRLDVSVRGIVLGLSISIALVCLLDAVKRKE